MDTDKLRMLCLAIDAGSLTKAAEQSGYTQSGMTHMMNALEREVGFPLLSRTRTGVVLTAEGSYLLPHIRALLAADERLAQELGEVRGLHTGFVRLASFASISMHWLPSVITEFEKKYPNIEIQFFEGESDEMATWLSEGMVDMCLTSRPADSGLDWIPLAQDPLVALLPPEHPLAGEGSVSLSQLEDEPFLMFNNFDGLDRDVERAFIAADFHPKVKYSSNYDYSIISMVERGLGVSVLPKLVLKDSSRKVAALPLQPPAYRELGIALPSRKNVSPAIERFIGCIRQVVVV